MNENFDKKEVGGLLARLAVGGVFIYSGWVKLMAPAEEFAFAIETYKVINSQLAVWVAYVFPWIELWAGLLLAAGVFTRLMCLFNMGMLVFFELLLGQALLRGLKITSCGCFGASGSNTIGQEFIQNLALICLAFAVFRYGQGFSADRAVAAQEGSPEDHAA